MPLKLLLFVSAIACSCTTTSQTATTEKSRASITNLGGSDWVFTADVALPQSGRSRQISGGYEVTFSSAKLVVYLPYFGEAHAGADIYSGRGPLDFTSTDFTSATQTKKGEWDITIKPKDYKEVQSMDFTFYDNGNAHLNVTMLNHSAISFSGTVEQVKS